MELFYMLTAIFCAMILSDGLTNIARAINEINKNNIKD